MLFHAGCGGRGAGSQALPGERCRGSATCADVRRSLGWGAQPEAGHQGSGGLGPRLCLVNGVEALPPALMSGGAWGGVLSRRLGTRV
ncbi:MAG: hypothetical protein AAF327_12580, partial [Cyanobacteria bacterium P01_A01_bin.37]